jgi:2-polyprenyl-3-methyl-5-hydroxy-6-metoxy-1,4-benzoquinol methylase
MRGRCIRAERRSELAVRHSAARRTHWLLDSCNRIPLLQAGFKMQRAHPFAAAGLHVYVWLDGDHYTGTRPHSRRPPLTGSPAQIAQRFEQAGDAASAQAILDATAAYTSQDEASYYAGNLRFLEPAYLRATTTEGGSGFGGDSARWRARRAMIVDGIDRNGTFLDLGCANGLLMESVVAWAAERGYRVEPYGLDFAPGLVEMARRRLPHWADRIYHGNAIDWIPPDGRRFTLVHTLLDLVPVARRADLVRHALGHLVEPSGRLLVSHYQSARTSDPPVEQILRNLVSAVTGYSSARDNPRKATAWIDIHKNGS